MAGPGKIGFAVVGLGNIARVAVLPAFRHCKKAKLAALVSRDPKKAAVLQKKFRALTAFGANQYAECLAHPEVSAVYIATPPREHEDFTIRAAEAGKHVLCEKPLAATAAQSARMVEACRRNGVLLMTAYRKYFEPASLYLKKLVRAGDLGRIEMIHTSFSERFNPDSGQPWLLNRALAGGGPLMDLGVYCVNTCRWLVDEDPVEVSAQSWSGDKARFKEVEEGITFRMSFASGLIVLGSSTYSAAMSSFIVVQGMEGWASLFPAYPFEYVRRVTGQSAGKWIDRRFKPTDEFALEIDALASAIQNHETVEPDGAQGHRDMLILQAIYESAKRRQPVATRY